ncbi:MAG: hypothetical protein AB7E04_08540 [Desulfobacteraceae bacterium]
MPSTSDLEQQIFEREEIRVIIRQAKNSPVKEYPYERKSSSSTSITDLVSKRIQPLVGDSEITVINGQGLQPHGRTNVETVRNSYKG